MAEFSEEEQKALKELAQNLVATGRVRRMATGALLWVSGIVGAGLIIWNAWVQFTGKQ